MKSNQRHKTQIDLRTLGSHDTREGNITGLIQDISIEMEHTPPLKLRAKARRKSGNEISKAGRCYELLFL